MTRNAAYFGLESFLLLVFFVFLLVLCILLFILLLFNGLALGQFVFHAGQNGVHLVLSVGVGVTGGLLSVIGLGVEDAGELLAWLETDDLFIVHHLSFLVSRLDLQTLLLFHSLLNHLDLLFSPSQHCHFL